MEVVRAFDAKIRGVYGISKRTAIGFDADLIVLERHPLEDIHTLSRGAARCE